MSHDVIDIVTQQSSIMNEDQESAEGQSAELREEASPRLGIPSARRAMKTAASAAKSPSRWVAIFGLVYGMGPSDDRVATTIVKNQLYWFARGAMLVTGLLSAIVMFLYWSGGAVTQRRCIIGSAIYAVVLLVTSVFFVLRQKKQDRLHGRVKAEFELVDLKPATPTEFKKAISSGALASWAWLLLAAYAKGSHGTLGVGVVVMGAFTSLRRHQSTQVTTVPAQMKYQAVNFAVHVSLSSAVFWAADLWGTPVEILENRPWLPCISVLVIGFVSAAITWRAANKIEKKLQGAILD